MVKTSLRSWNRLSGVRGSECGKTDRFVKVELVCSIEGGEGELPSHDGTRTESELCQLGQSGC